MQTLIIQMAHEFFLMGNVYPFAELGVRQKNKKRTYYWKNILILPPDQVRVKKLPLSDISKMEYILDPETAKNPKKIPKNLRKQIKSGFISLNTDPKKGSFAHHLARKLNQYDTLGVSLLERYMKGLIFEDKIEQASALRKKKPAPKMNQLSHEINRTSCLLLVEVLQDYIEQKLFKPLAEKNGFKDSEGQASFPHINLIPLQKENKRKNS